ncbi:MAG: N-acetylmuramoyl-L-alanine amidase [Aestuariibacter sp.]
MIRSIFWLLICCAFQSISYASDNSINSVRIWPSPNSTRVVFDLEKAPQYSYFTLTNPHRLVIDLAAMHGKVDFSQFENKSQLLKLIRHSTPKDKNSLRVVLELNKKINPQVFSLVPTAPYGDRLVVDLTDPSPTEKVIEPRMKERSKDIIIAIDAGHGGEDPGSIGRGGTYEKNVTIRIAKRLEKLVNNEPGMHAVLTRTGDYHIDLNQRPGIARENKADLFVSIHADAFTQPGPNGASVWVLSMGRANSELGRWMESTEKHSELLGGAAEVIQDVASERYLTQALLDMSMDHSIATSYDVGRNILGELKQMMKLHKKSPQAASLAVLTSPDIPSVLVETGFISNPKEEKNLNWAKHQQNLAEAIFNGIKQHFSIAPPDGTLWASRRPSALQHRVARGESLSVLAQRYNVTVSNIKKANNLNGDMVRIGQVLNIPRS